MGMETNCIFCNKPTSMFHDCRVCDSCRTVSNFSLSQDELFVEARKCIVSIQECIESISETLHNIEERYINNEYLSPSENRIRDFCSCFQSCRSELEFMITNHINSQDKHFRMNLYTLSARNTGQRKCRTPRFYRRVRLL